jgi:REP element-mobilizing transposase RayT
MPRVKHYFEPGHFYHITTRTEGGVHAFASDNAKKFVTDALSFYRDRGEYQLYAYVIMANHVHCVVSATEKDLCAAVGKFKKYISHQCSRADGERLWERRFDDNAILHAPEMRDVVQYIHRNPVRIGLVPRAEDYFWSSARNYAKVMPVATEVKTDW